MNEFEHHDDCRCRDCLNGGCLYWAIVLIVTLAGLQWLG